MYEQRTGDASSACRIETVFYGYVVIYDYIVGFDSFVLCHVDRHFEVQDISRIVLHDGEDAGFGCNSFDSFVNLIGGWRSKYGARYGAVEHTFTDVASVCRLMTAAAAGDERDFALLFLSAYDDVSFREFFEFFWRCLGKTLDHFTLDIFYFVDEFFHAYTPFWI